MGEVLNWQHNFIQICGIRMSLLQMTSPLNVILKYVFEIYMFISKTLEVSVQYVPSVQFWNDSLGLKRTLQFVVQISLKEHIRSKIGWLDANFLSHFFSWVFMLPCGQATLEWHPTTTGHGGNTETQVGNSYRLGVPLQQLDLDDPHLLDYSFPRNVLWSAILAFYTQYRFSLSNIFFFLRSLLFTVDTLCLSLPYLI